MWRKIYRRRLQNEYEHIKTKQIILSILCKTLNQKVNFMLYNKKAILLFTRISTNHLNTLFVTLLSSIRLEQKFYKSFLSLLQFFEIQTSDLVVLPHSTYASYKCVDIHGFLQFYIYNGTKKSARECEEVKRSI